MQLLLDRLGALGSSSALGLGLTLVVLVALRVILPRSHRGLLRLPLSLLGLYLLAALLRLLVEPEGDWGNVLRVLSLFLLLTALGRSTFVLVVDGVIGLRFQRPLSRIIRDILQGLSLVIIALVTLRAAGVEPSSLLTTSALLTAVIGLSLQDTLGNLVSGLSIQAQHPFEVGDWIQIDADTRLIGRVLEINWRATRVLTLEQIELTIPNGTLARAQIRNFTKPTPIARRTLDVQAPYDVSPERVEAVLLTSLRDMPGVLSEPAPFVLIPRFEASAIAYQLCFFIDDFARRDRIDSLARKRIWTAFQRAGIAFPYSVHTVQMHESTHEQHARLDREQRARRLRSLKAVDFLATIPPALLDRLAELSRTECYASGEQIVRQGDAGQELYIVQTGEVSVSVGREGGSSAEVARLGHDSCFGEMSLMTGEPRIATVTAISECELVVVDRVAFHDILANAPGVAEKLTEVLAERQLALEERVSARRVRTKVEVEQKSSAMLAKLKSFIGI
ncbi:MAG: mechanosensitive ion channel family protein [Polyangiaceae bacterium]